MSNFRTKATNPRTGEEETAEYLDDYFGHHRYGVRFSDGKVYREEEITRVEEK